MHVNEFRMVMNAAPGWCAAFFFGFADGATRLLLAMGCPFCRKGRLNPAMPQLLPSVVRRMPAFSIEISPRTCGTPKLVWG